MDEVHVFSASGLCAVSRYDRNCILQGFLRPVSAPPEEGVLRPRELVQMDRGYQARECVEIPVLFDKFTFWENGLYRSFHMPVWISIIKIE